MTETTKRSDAITKGPAKAPARAMLRATGLGDKEFSQPMIAVVNTWSTVTPCNIHLDKLAEPVRQGVRAGGGTPIDFNTIVVSDGITMGGEGMRASLISREVIADSIEVAVRGHSLDAAVILVGCDKTIPAAAMALARMDIPGVIFYGGTILPGHCKFRGEERDLSIQDVFEAVGAHARGDINDDELSLIEKTACPGAGACGGQFTANTMAMALTFLGLSPMGAGDPPAVDEDKAAQAERCGELVAKLAKEGTSAPRIHYAEIVEKRRDRGCRQWRIHQCCSAFAGNRSGSRCFALNRYLRRSFPHDPGHHRFEARRPVPGEGPVCRGRYGPFRQTVDGGRRP